MKKKALIVLVGVLGVLCIVCGALLLWGGKPTPKTQNMGAEASAKETPQPESTPTAEPVDETPYESPIDFAALQAENPDIYAWLTVPNTDIDYPLVQRAGDDSFYLTHDSDGNENATGAIFTESTYNGTSMEDPVTVAYGHQMHTGTMFGKLQAVYSDPDSLTECSEMIVYLPDKELHYTVFAAVPYDNRHILYNFDFTDTRRYNAFLNSIYDVRAIGAQFSDTVVPSTDDKLLILSTCLQGNPQKRYLVLAKCETEID